jgi:exopolysaccharide biosynthesis predicted pyruvyltransferase EpsI
MGHSYKIYEEIFMSYAGTNVGYLRMYGNVGDHLIEMATFELFKKYNINATIVNKDDITKIDLPENLKLKTVFIAGGGNLGKTYIENYNLRSNLLNKFSLETIVLPQSLTDSQDDNKYSKVWLRDPISFNSYPNTKSLSHDLAFAVDLTAFKELKPNCKNGFLLREDREKLIDNRKMINLNDPVYLVKDLTSYIKLASTFERIITDRLHFAIIALKLNRKVVLLANSYHKNESVYNHSIKNYYEASFAKNLSEIFEL